MEFSVLGTLTARHGDVRLDLGPTKQQVLLAALLLNANRPLSVGSLIKVLWESDPPLSAGKNLQLYVSRLRRAFATVGADDRLRTVTRGYLLIVEPGELDLERFRALVRLAATAVRNEAAPLYESALHLWRGRPLAGLADIPGLDAEVGVLDDLRRSAAEDYFDLLLETGRERAAIPQMRRLVRAHPYLERPRFQLMLALARAGDRAAALATYRTFYRDLSDEFGIEPGPQLRDLHLAILSGTMWSPSVEAAA